MAQENSQKQSSTEELAGNMSFAISRGVKVFFWLWSLVIGIIALGMFFSNMRIPAILMMGAAVFCNPHFLQYAFNKAAREGESPPSIFLMFFLAFVFFCSSIGFSVYQPASDTSVESSQQNNETIEPTAKNALSPIVSDNNLQDILVPAESKELVQAFCFALQASLSCNNLNMRFDTESKIQHQVGGKFRDPRTPYNHECMLGLVQANNVENNSLCDVAWKQYGCFGTKTPKLIQENPFGNKNGTFCEY